VASADSVSLADLGVITRYSLAVRVGNASREELIAVLRDDLAWLEGATSAEPVDGTQAPAKAAGRRSRARE
jgi:hypothetical protein